MKSEQESLELIRRHIDGEASEADRKELQEQLRRNPTTRRLFARYANIDATLGSGSITLKKPALRAKPIRTAWLSWRPLTAAAAGIVFGMFCTSLVFGYSMPRMVERVLNLVNGGFEEPVALLPDGIPLRFGVWSGDYSEIVGEQQGIVPHEGKRMFRFLRSDSKDGFPLRAYHGNMYQFIDIRPWREAISSGTAVVDWSAWFDCIGEGSGKPSKFEASMWAFAGEPSVVRKSWEEKLHQELAYSTWRAVADADPKTWQRVAGSLIVPPDADFLAVEIKVMVGDETPVNGVVTFGGHYADDVQMVLRTNAREHPQKLTKAKP